VTLVAIDGGGMPGRVTLVAIDGGVMPGRA
jgi:hypothetical protein